MSDDIDLDDLLDITSSTVTNTYTDNITSNLTNTLTTSSNQSNDFSDFLDWLDGDTTTSLANDPILNKITSVENIDINKSNNNIINNEIKGTNNSSIIDSFMDELYGETVNAVSNVTTNLSINPINSTTTSNSDNSTNDNYIKPRDYENDIISILRSSFPDLIQLKQYIYELGYIPNHLRCDIWNMLLTGATSEDYDLLTFDYTQNLSSFNGSFDLLINDCKNLISLLSSNDNTINTASLTADIINIIILYCLRKNKPYHPLLLNAILPLALTSNKKSITLSSSFYSLIDNFVAFGKLDTISFELAQDTVHSWLRLLVIYHTPSVAQHLDQILPGWERPARYNTTSLEVDKLITILESTSNFDKLDRELGLDAIEDPLGWTITSDSSNSSSNDIINNNSFNGCIPNSWISGLFVHSLPNQLVAFIFDLAILEEDKYFGIYMIVTLIDIYSDILLTMSKQQLQAWFQSIYLGKFEWFKISTNPLTRNYFQSISLDKSNTVDWKSFISGWLQATIALRKATPIGFRKSLIETDEWSLETVISNKQAIARLLDNSKDERNEEESNILSNKPSEAIYSIEDDEDEAEEVNKNEITSINQSNDNITLLQRYITICKEIKQEYINNNFYDKSISNEKKWQQDNKIDGNILNIWSTTDEVVPCIISNKRRANTTLSVSKYFELGIQSFRNNKDLQLLFPSSNHIEEPFYFGIDCRSNNEKKLGIFPKTFSLDPVLLTDSDEVNKILETLEPLASSVHLCIIGAGEDYYKWKEANSQTSKNIWQGLLLSKTNSIPSTSSLSISEESNLNSVAMFFMKKSFKHVSVLDGGFTAAAKYLYENQSHNGLISNLVDCDINLLESVLGIQVSHIGTAIASNSANGSYDSKSVSMNSLLSSFNNVTSALLKPLPVSNNQQIHSSSTASENITDPNVVKATPVTESISLTNTKELFTGFSKKLSLFGASSYETIKKSVNTVSTTINNTINDKESNSKNDEGFVLVGKKHSNVIDTQTAFVIDDDEDEDDLDRSDDNTKPIIKDTHGVSIQRTDTERQQALVLHRLAGIRKGDNITITKDYLPGAVLFPCYKLKPVVKSKDLVDQIVDSVTTNEVTSTDINNNSASTEKVNEETLVVPVHRYLVVTKERFMVIDSNGKGVGSEANVKSNHHLTELVKMTFRKKDPELVSLFLQNGDELKSHQYRVPKKQDFLNILQKNMQKFK